MRNLRMVKGVVLFMAFLGAAISLALQPNVGVAKYFHEVGITMPTVAVGFAVSAFMNLFIGITGRSWNVIWFVVMFMYTGMAWIVAFNDPNAPMITCFLYSLLSSLLLIDWILDIQGEYHLARTR